MSRLHHALRAVAGVSSGGEGGWTPDNITTALWLDAADEDTIALNSGNVSQWDDKSGNGRHVSQGDSSYQPPYNTSGSISFVDFSGVDYLTGSFPALGSSRRSAFVVVKSNSTSGENWILNIGSDVATDPGAAWCVTNEVALRVSGGNRVWSDSSTNMRILGVDSGGTATADALCWINGEMQTSTSTANRTYVTTGGIIIGAWLGGSAGDYLDGHIYEVILVEGETSSSNRQKIEGYLAHKWGLVDNLPSDHPYKNEAP